MIQAHEAQLKAGLAAALVVLGLLLAAELPAAGFAGRGPGIQASPPGRLRVVVAMNNGSGYVGPLSGVLVGVTQASLGGLRLLLITNGSGEVGFPLPAGGYTVSASDPKFALTTAVTVDTGRVTTLRVVVNRTAYTSSYVEATDSTTQGTLEPWNTLAAEIPDSGYPLFQLPGSNETVYIVGGFVSQPGNLTFGPTVFLQTVGISTYGVGYIGFVYGSEVPATVVAQTAQPGSTWLTLQPSKPIQVLGAESLLIVSYRAGSTVSLSND